jgi:hypothetical protein
MGLKSFLLKCNEMMQENIFLFFSFFNARILKIEMLIWVIILKTKGSTRNNYDQVNMVE